MHTINEIEKKIFFFNGIKQKQLEYEVTFGHNCNTF